MRAILGLLLAFIGSACPAAEIYRWTDEKGVVNYGEKPPANRPAQPVNTDPNGSIEAAGTPDGKAAADTKRPAAELRRPQPDAAPTPVPPSAAVVRGMDFDTFIRLQQGMTEGELMLRAGRPDYESVDSFRRDIVKTFYYFPTTSNPYTTVVTLRGGRIFNIERIKKL